MFPLFLGFFGSSFFENLLNSSSDSSNSVKNVMVNAVNDDVFKALKDFVKTYEGFDTKAYNLGDGKITIGYGSTNWLNANGTIIRPVRMGDTITEIEAEKQLRYFFYPIIPKLNYQLSSQNLQVSQYFLASLLNFCYMSGSGFLDWEDTREMIRKVNQNRVLSSVALILKNDMVAIYKKLKTNATERAKYGQNKQIKWQIYGTGWSRRIQASADLIEGKAKPKKWYDTNIKKAF